MADPCDKAYAAGLFDGEGCVQLYLRPGTYRDPKAPNNSFRSALSVSSVDLSPLEWLIERWGGTITIYAGEKRISAGHRPLGRWLITGKQAEAFARDIHPYLITKREQVRLFLVAREMTYRRGQKGPHNRGLETDEIATRREIVDQVKALKRVEHIRG